MLKSLSFTALALTFLSGNALADDVRTRYLMTTLSEAVPHVKIVDIKESELTGLYQVNLESGIVYATADGKFILQGDLLGIDKEGITNFTEKALNAKRVKEIAAFKSSDMIIYSPKGKPKHTLTMFTDVDCGFCRKQHEEIAKLNAAGVEVRYIPFPRNGVDTDTGKKMQNVWCQRDRKRAISNVKTDAPVPNAPASCKSTAVANGFALGQRVGVSGTPAIFNENGQQLGGYLTFEQMAPMLPNVK